MEAVGNSTFSERDDSISLPSFDVSMPDYLSQYGLSFDPFVAESSDNGFYPGGGRLQLLESLEHQVIFSANLLVVSGSKGVGKSHFCREMQAGIADAPVVICSLAINPETSVEVFVAELVLALNLKALTDLPLGQQLVELRRHLQQPSEVGMTLLLVDDAHHLDAQSLSTLVSLLQGQSNLERSFCVALFAEPNFLGRLAVTDIGDLLLHDVLIEVFTVEGLREYLQWLFQRSGSAAELPIGDDRLREWLQASGGDVSQILASAHQWLLESVTASVIEEDLGVVAVEPGSESSWPFMHLIAVALLSLVLVSAYLFHGDADSLMSDEAVEVPLEAPLEVADVSSVDIAVPVSLQGLGISVDAVENSRDAWQELISDVADSVAVAPVREPVVTSSEDEDINMAGVVEDELKQSSRQVLVSDIELSNNNSAAEAVAVPAEIEVVASGAAVLAKSPSEQKLMQYDASSYALQVLAAASKVSVDKFIMAQPNREALHVYESRRAGLPWFVVVTGNHASIDLARSAVARLPKAQRNAGPWPRSLASIQTDIRAVGDI